jgi:hypothetical protein
MRNECRDRAGQLEGNVPKPEEDATAAVGSALSKASQRYGELTLLRAAVQSIPWVGSALDTLLSGRGSQIQRERVLHFLGELDSRLHQIETVSGIDEECLYDLMLNVFDSVIRTRSESKRARFAQLVANQIASGKSWDDAEIAAALLRDLTEAHVAILVTASKAPVCSGPFEGLRVVTLHEKAKSHGASSLIDSDVAIPGNATAMRMACSELVSRGLLLDEGVGRLDTGAMEFFILTELGEWFLDWVATSDSPGSPGAHR